MRKISRYLNLSLVLFIAVLLQAGLFAPGAYTQEEIHPKLKALFELTGVKELVENYGETFLQGIRSEIRTGGFGKLENLAYSSFDSSKIYAFLDQEFKSGWNEGYADVLIAKFETPLFKNFLERERYSETEEGKAEFREYQQNFLLNKYASQDRIDIVKEFYIATGSVDLAVEAVSDITHSMLVASNNLSDVDARMSDGEIEKSITEFKDQMRPQMEQALMLQYLFMYSNFSDDDLKNYIAFHKSAEMQWFIQRFNTAFLHAIKLCNVEFTSGLVKFFQEENKKEPKKETLKE